MKNYLGLTLAVLAIVALAASQADARGGGHGGGHHGGGHHGGHHASSHHHSHHHTGTHHHDHHHHVHYAGHHRPFSSGWGGGWGNYGWNRGYGNAWVGAGLGATATWLGLSAINNGGVAGYPANGATVLTGDTSDTGAGFANSAIDRQTVTDDGSQADQAAELATTGEAALPTDAKFLSLGVFSLAPEDQTEASAMLHLAVSTDGILRGSYVDLLSNQEHEIEGAVDKTTQRVAWTVAPKGEVVFDTSLKNLTEETSPLSVHFENGETRQWTLARYEGDDLADDTDASAEESTDR
jgi:hypothetical protein